MYKTFAHRIWSALLAAAISPVVCTTGLTHGTWPDGPNKQWLESLQRPDNDQHPHRKSDPKSLSCCGAADTVQTKFKVENSGGQYPEDTWYAWLKESWVKIPPERSFKITRRMVSPISSCWLELSSVSCGRRAASKGSNEGDTNVTPPR